MVDIGKEPTRTDRIRANSFARYVERPYGWQYNEIIGWVRLLWDGPGPVIKGYLWQVGKKTLDGGEARHRYQRGFIPFPFVYGKPLYKVLEEWFDSTQTDLQVYEQLRAGLLRIVDRNGALPRRHIDPEVFDTLAPQVRWRRLLSLEGDP